MGGGGRELRIGTNIRIANIGEYANVVDRRDVALQRLYGRNSNSYQFVIRIFATDS